MRSAVVQGISVNGFRETLLQSQREYHLMISVQWRAYIDHLRQKRPLIDGATPAELNALQRQDFVEYDSTTSYDSLLGDFPTRPGPGSCLLF